MNALGSYLLTSLFFVIGTLIELGIVLEIKRISDQRVKNEVQPKQRNRDGKFGNQKNTGMTTSKAGTIDRAAFVTFNILFFTFNVVYWMHYLS